MSGIFKQISVSIEGIDPNGEPFKHEFTFKEPLHDVVFSQRMFRKAYGDEKDGMEFSLSLASDIAKR